MLAVREVADARAQPVVDCHLPCGLPCSLTELSVPSWQDHRAQVTAAGSEDRQEDAVLDAQAEQHPRLLVGPCQSQPRPVPRRRVGDVVAEELHGSARGRDVTGDNVEERRLAGTVRPQDRAALSGEDVEIHVAHRVEAAKLPADPPPAEGRLGGYDGSCYVSQPVYLMNCLVIELLLTTWIFPCQGSLCFTHGGCARPGGGLVFLNTPPND